jgi:hypothetical protein
MQRAAWRAKRVITSCSSSSGWRAAEAEGAKLTTRGEVCAPMFALGEEMEEVVREGVGGVGGGVYWGVRATVMYSKSVSTEIGR